MNMEEGDKAAAAVAVAPRVSLADIEALIVSEHHFNAGDMARAASYPGAWKDADADGPLSLLSICILVLKNGYTILGTSACASPENFNAELGRKFAREDAIRQVWPLAGYELKSRLMEGW